MQHSSSLEYSSGSPSPETSGTTLGGGARGGCGEFPRPAWIDGASPGFQPKQPRGPPQYEQKARLQSQWQSWPELCVIIRNLPLTATILDIWKLMEKEGAIDFIRVMTNRKTGFKTGMAQVKFRPIPKQDFWSDRDWVIRCLDGSYCRVGVHLDTKPPRSFTIPSEVSRGVRHPESLTFVPQSFGFGVMAAEHTMMVKKTISLAKSELFFHVDFRDKAVVVTFDDRELELGSPSSERTRYKFQIRFEDMKHINRVTASDGISALVISLEHPPRFFCQPRNNIRDTLLPDALIWSERDSWFRATDVVDVATLATREVSLSKSEAPVLDMGRWLTYMFTFDNEMFDSNFYAQMRNALNDFNLEISESADFHTEPSTHVEVWDSINRQVVNSGMEDMACMLDNVAFFSLPFEVRYQLEVCISHNILEEHSIKPEFISVLAEISAKDKVHVLSMLEYLVAVGKRVWDPQSIFTNPNALAHTRRAKIPLYCEYARKATVTPTTIYLGSPSVEISNRVIRRYADYGDRFLRVQFTDENKKAKLGACAEKTTNDALFTRVFRTLKNGIRIGDRHYEFLAFGNSQFREHGAYFFSPTDDLTCNDIRKWMGSFLSIRNPAKYASRLGLCFSTTRAMKNRKVKILTIPDVERNGHCFTDGVGKISSFLMRMIQVELRLPEEPSIIQFRMGGCKGVLAMSPDVAPYEVHIRKSQNKFPAEYNGLEIIRTSQFSPATLNRQTITILSCLGVEDEVFIQKLEEQLVNYNEALTDPDKANELLRRYIDEAHTTTTIAAMVHNDFMRTGDPFVNSLLHLWRSWSIKLLKEKAKIIIEKGAFVFGCTDETQTLRGHVNKPKSPGAKVQPLDIEDLPQIFLQVTDPNNPGQTNIIEGLCVVGRNPSMHPGDIRICQAIDNPALHHLRDCVVFSQLGDVDVASMCSGGDLDGDDFFVLWDKEFIPREWNAEPMDFTSPQAYELHRNVGIDDVMAFFVTYMKNDSLPRIAHAHLAWSDYLPDSVKDPKCIELAALHSKAVDYVKSGVPAILPKHLRPQLWPHFMEKTHLSKSKTYISNSVVGQLYDRVMLVDFKPQYESPFDARILNAYPEHKTTLCRARKLKSDYDTAMLRIMAQHGIHSEFEVWTSFLLSRPAGFNDYKAGEAIAEIAEALKERFRAACIEAAGGDDFCTLAPFVAAMYRVTSEEMQCALKECKMFKTVGGRQLPKRKMEPKSMPLISFPWLFPDKLGRIAMNSEPFDPLFDLAEVPLKSITDRSRKQSKVEGEAEDEEDIIDTADGVMHRGEMLGLFKNVEEEESDDEEVKKRRVDDYMEMIAPLSDKPEDVDFAIPELDEPLERLQGSMHASAAGSRKESAADTPIDVGEDAAGKDSIVCRVDTPGSAFHELADIDENPASFGDLADMADLAKAPIKNLENKDGFKWADEAASPSSELPSITFTDLFSDKQDMETLKFDGVQMDKGAWSLPLRRITLSTQRNYDIESLEEQAPAINGLINPNEDEIVIPEANSTQLKQTSASLAGQLMLLENMINISVPKTPAQKPTSPSPRPLDLLPLSPVKKGNEKPSTAKLSPRMLVPLSPIFDGPEDLKTEYKEAQTKPNWGKEFDDTMVVMR